MSDPSLPPFTPRFPWWSGDLQTLRNRLVPGRYPLPGTTETRLIPLSDGSGDQMMVQLDTPEESAEGPLVVLIHGLMGCDHSAYMLASARFHLSQGRRVLRVNLRGAGPSAKYATRFYFAGCWPDIVAVLDALAPETPDGFFLAGFSLGGSVTLNALPNLPERLSIVGAATVSTPIDPMDAARQLMKRRNVIYSWAFIREMKRSYRRLDILTPEMHANLDKADSILAVDDAATAPLHGYPDVATYYDATAGHRMIPRIEVPLLLIHSEDDPWIPPAPYHALRDALPPNVSLTLTRRGGHVGFHGTHGPEAWHDLRIDAFLREIAA